MRTPSAIARIAEQRVYSTPSGKVALDPAVEVEIAQALEAVGADPEIAEAVLECFDLAMKLFSAGAEEAAASVLRGLAEAQPRLTGLPQAFTDPGLAADR
jgi:hypothetical protein